MQAAAKRFSAGVHPAITSACFPGNGSGLDRWRRVRSPD